MASANPDVNSFVAGSSMVLNWEIDVKVLFPFWRTYGIPGMLITSICIGVSCFLLEWFREYRHHQDPQWLNQLESFAYTNTPSTQSIDDIPLHTRLPTHTPSTLHMSHESVLSNSEWQSANTDVEPTNPSWATLQEVPIAHGFGTPGDTNSVNLKSPIVPPMRHLDRASIWRVQLIRTIAYMTELGSSLVIMSIFMLLNGWISLAIICGTSLGFFLFRMGGSKTSRNGRGIYDSGTRRVAASASC
ncbi:hypothetical protein BDV3_003727 [Batrachochytrium dendrobatidis]|uniref:Copper transport protein n=1 Tax=Batrachochytrium dendrobatidis (strain JEL423) TaxID=403673 RepID=A0A177WEQ3_BATDL|nr:hypothetical protein BDEG_22117 [Batrachochytrium dendrobatidis JEL423]